MNIVLDNKELEMLKGHIGTNVERTYKYLKQFCSNKEKVFPKQEYLAEQLGVSTKTIKRCVATLKKLGMLGVDKNWKINNYSIVSSNAPVSKPQEVKKEVNVSSQEVEMLKEKISKMKKENEERAIEMQGIINRKEKRISSLERSMNNMANRIIRICNLLGNNENFYDGFTMEAVELNKLERDIRKYFNMPQQEEQPKDDLLRDLAYEVDFGKEWELR